MLNRIVLLLVFSTLTPSLATKTYANTESLPSCTPSCAYDQAAAVPVSFPDTIFTAWAEGGDVNNIPQGPFTFDIHTDFFPEVDHVSFAYFAYAFSPYDLYGTMRHAVMNAELYWSSWANGSPGWTKDAGNNIAFTGLPDDPPVSPADISENPEPGTWLLMITGVTLLVLTRLFGHRFNTMMSSK